MAKIIVEIDIHNFSYEELKRGIIDEPEKGMNGWFSEEDGDKV